MVKGYHGIETLTRCNFKNLAVCSSCECLLSNATGNSDSQTAILEITENQYPGN